MAFVGTSETKCVRRNGATPKETPVEQLQPNICINSS